MRITFRNTAASLRETLAYLRYILFPPAPLGRMGEWFMYRGAVA